MTPRPMSLLAALALAAAPGCDFNLPRYQLPEAGVPSDGPPPDAMSCEPNTITCDDAAERYVDCGPDGSPEVEIQCPLGCSTEREYCLDVAPSNGLAGFLDQARDDELVVDVVFTGVSTIDTDSGDVVNAGVPIEVPIGMANGIRVFMFKELEIAGTLKVTGTLPLALIADGTIGITGALDVSGDMENNGPGAVVTGPCVGVGFVGTSPAPGAGGGGRYEAGGAGGNSYSGGDAELGGEAVSVPTLEPLEGGCRGGESRTLASPTPPSKGGGGGGAVQLVSRRAVVMTGGGVIDASGGGGATGDFFACGGGGAGGGVLIEAPSIVLDGPGVVISTKGGSGASASTNGPGTDGGIDATAAPGGVITGHARGGNGGTETTAPQAGGNGNSTNTKGGGGGGSVGEARFNDRTESVLPSGGASIRSQYGVGPIGSRQMQL